MAAKTAVASSGQHAHIGTTLVILLLVLLCWLLLLLSAVAAVVAVVVAVAVVTDSVCGSVAVYGVGELSL